MKLILLAAAAAIAVPALAQTTTPPPTSGGGQSTATMSPSDPAADQATMPADPPAMPDQSAMPAPSDTMPQSTTMPAAGDATGADPVGGYQPAQMPMSGTPAPGATVRFQQAMSPDQAYPAPAPLKSYPPCKKGQYDNCMQRGSRR